MTVLPTVTLNTRLKPTQHITLRSADAQCHQVTAYGLTRTLESAAELGQSLEHTPRFPGFIFAFIGFLVLSSAWIRMVQTSSMVDFLEWMAIGIGFFMLAFVRRDWVRGGL